MICEMYHYLAKIHETCVDPSTGRYAALLYWSYKFKLVVNIFRATLTLTFVVLLLYPLVWYMLTGEVETMLPIMLPLVDESTRNGYIACMVIQTVWVMIAGIGIMVSELTFSMLTLYCLPLVDVFCDHMDGLNVALRTDRRYGETAEMREYFGNLLLLHKDVVA